MVPRRATSRVTWDPGSLPTASTRQTPIPGSSTGPPVSAGARRSDGAGPPVTWPADAEPGGLYAEGDGTFEFQRTVSRLEEMRSAEYLAEGHGAVG